MVTIGHSLSRPINAHTDMELRQETYARHLYRAAHHGCSKQCPPPPSVTPALWGVQTLTDRDTSRESTPQPAVLSSARMSPCREQSEQVIVSLSTLNPLLCIRTHMTSSLRQPELFSINRFTVCWCFPKAVSSRQPNLRLRVFLRENELGGEDCRSFWECVFICHLKLGVLCCFCLYWL